MEKLKAIKVKQNNGQYGQAIPIGAQAVNIDINTQDKKHGMTCREKNLQDVIGVIYVKKEENADYAYMQGSIAEQLQQTSLRLKDLQYVPIAINSFTSTPSGTQQVSNEQNITVNFTWTLNKQAAEIKEMKFDTEVILDKTTRSTSKTISNPATSGYGTKTWTLSVTDVKAVKKGEQTATKGVTVTWCNNIYYGASIVPGEVNDTFVKGLTSKLQNTRGLTVANMGAASGNKYYWYACPVRLGQPTFSIGGFASRLEKTSDVSVTNDSGFTENYNVYRTQNANPGTGAFVVS